MQPAASISTSSLTSMKKLEFPPGFKFCPSDKQLIVDFLANKIKNLPVPCDVDINEVMVYDYSPDYLAAEHEQIGEKEWYFFIPRAEKWKQEDRPNSGITGGYGYWRASKAAKPVIVEDIVVGFKRFLVFYNDKPGSESQAKTNWCMTEYYMENLRLDWTLCRIYNEDDKSKDDESSASSQKNSECASTSNDSC